MQRVCLLSLALGVGLLGCSDPVPPAARAALTLSLLQPPSSVTPDTCDVGAATYEVGGSPGPTSTTNVKDNRAVAGDPNVRGISCTVKSSDGTNFSVSGSINVDNGLNRSTGMVARVAFSLGGGTLVAGGTGTGRISVTTPDVGSIGGDQCDLLLNTGQLQIQPGAVWANFNCPLLNNTSSPGKACQANGTFILENCTQE